MKRLFPFTIFILSLILASCTTVAEQKPVNEKKEEISRDLPKIKEKETAIKPKKHNDTIVYMTFKDLSNVYNYKMIDKYFFREGQWADSISRIIKIYNKNDSLIQRIQAGTYLIPWYMSNKKLKLSRSYITGKNENEPVIDDYFGELVIADLNFDGLEDFATVTDYGCDNGSHFEFYIQKPEGKFKRNKYLTENVTWFPKKINDSLQTFTTILSVGVYGIGYTTYKYDSINQRWKEISHYLRDVNTGKIMK